MRDIGCLASMASFRLRLLAGTALAGLLLPAAAATAQVLPTGGQVRAGQVTIGPVAGNRLTVTQSSAKGVVGWDSFSIGAGHVVHFANGAGATLNRVAGNVPSTIDGALTATGSVYLVNPAGVTVGSGGMVATGGSFLASTHDVGDAEFLTGGGMTFQGTSDAAVVNHGRIESAGGDVALIARRVDNAGAISAPAGTAALAAGYEVLARPADTGAGRFAVRVGGADTEARTSGAIHAAAAEIRANGGNVYALAGNTGGIVRATGVAAKGGRVFLTAKGGAVTIDGTVDATNAAGPGGIVVATGEHVDIGAAARIDASGASGGTVLIGGDWQGGADPAKRLLPSIDVATAQQATVAAGARISADGGKGAGGGIVVWADGATSSHGDLSARGTTGGRIETSGKTVDVGGRIDAGPGGLWLLDPTDLVIDAGLAGTIASTLNAGTNVTQQTAAAGSENGDITVAAPIAWTTDADLTLEAHRHIVIDAEITSSGAGDVTLRADREGLGTGTVSRGAGGRVNVVSVSGTSSGVITIFYNPASYSSLPPFTYADFTSFGTTAYMLVNTVDQLQAMSDNLAGRYALGRDIDAGTTAGWDGGKGFAPIGNATTPFTGKFHGLGHTIDGLTIIRPNETHVGLFGSVRDTTIRDVGLTNVRVEGLAYVGGLVGHLEGSNPFAAASSVTDAFVTGGADAVSGNVSVGGLVGWGVAKTGGAVSIVNSHATGAVTANGEVGGLLGYAEVTNGTVSIVNSYATGAVSGHDNVGGLLGTASIGGGNMSIANSHATGAVSGDDWSMGVGGLIGKVDGTAATVSVTDSRASGNVTVGDGVAYVGGLAGAFFYYGNSLMSISTSHAAGNVTVGWDADHVGGLVGSFRGTLSNSHAAGNVTAGWGADQVGGLVGSFQGTLSNSHATGNVTTGIAPQSVGGLVGSLTGTVAKSYWDKEATGQANGVGNIFAGTFDATGLTTAEFQDTAGFMARAAGWDFYTVWAPSDAGHYPELYATSPVVHVVTDAMRVYGAADPAFSSVLYGGPGRYIDAAAGDTLAMPTVSAEADATSPVGAYTFTGPTTATSAQGQAYRVVHSGTLTVTPAPLTIVAKSLAKTYGDAYTFGGTDFLASGLVNGDTVDGVTLASAGAAAGATVGGGPYAIVGSGATGDRLGNYVISYIDGLLIVNPRPLVVAADHKAKPIGAADPVLTWKVTAGGLVAGDNLSGTLMRQAGEAPGAYAIGQGGLGAGGNYALTFLPGTFTIGSANPPVDPPVDPPVNPPVDPPVNPPVNPSAFWPSRDRAFERPSWGRPATTLVATVDTPSDDCAAGGSAESCGTLAHPDNRRFGRWLSMRGR